MSKVFTAEELKVQSRFAEAIQTAKDVAIYAGANNDGHQFQDDYFLAVANELREMQDYVNELLDEILVLRTENAAYKQELEQYRAKN